MINFDVYNLVNSNTTEVFQRTYTPPSTDTAIDVSRSVADHVGAVLQDQRAVRLLIGGNGDCGDSG
jgi:hypothetical protein